MLKYSWSYFKLQYSTCRSILCNLARRARKENFSYLGNSKFRENSSRKAKKRTQLCNYMHYNLFLALSSHGDISSECSVRTVLPFFAPVIEWWRTKQDAQKLRKWVLEHNNAAGVLEVHFSGITRFFENSASVADQRSIHITQSSNSGFLEDHKPVCCQGAAESI